MRFIERLLSFSRSPSRKIPVVQLGHPSWWPHLFAFGAPLLTAFILAAWGNSFMGGLGNVDNSVLGVSGDDAVALLRKYTLFIPLTGLPFFFWIFKQSDRSEWGKKLRVYFVYSFLVWAICYTFFLISMYMPRF